MFRKATLICMVVGLLSMSAMLCQAHAGSMSYVVTFDASGFTALLGSSVPVDPVTGSINITLDPTQTYTDETSGISLNSLTIPFAPVLGFSYDPTIYTGFLQIGSTLNGADAVVGGTGDDFLLQIKGFTTTPLFTEFAYTQDAIVDVFVVEPPLYGDTVTGTVTPVPLPPSVLLLGTGLLGLVGLGRRKSKKS